MVQFFIPDGQFPHLHLPHGGLNSVPNASTIENLVITFFEEIKFTIRKCFHFFQFFRTYLGDFHLRTFGMNLIKLANVHMLFQELGAMQHNYIL